MNTPTQTDRVPPEAARRALEARMAREAANNHRLWEKASADCDNIIRRFVETQLPTRIWQWGSILEPDAFREGSDIDIALEGVTDTEAFFGLLGEAMSRTRFPLDIVQLERIEPEFAAIIRAKGKIVYER